VYAVQHVVLLYTADPAVWSAQCCWRRTDDGSFHEL